MFEAFFFLKIISISSLTLSVIALCAITLSRLNLDCFNIMMTIKCDGYEYFNISNFYLFILVCCNSLFDLLISLKSLLLHVYYNINGLQLFRKVLLMQFSFRLRSPVGRHPILVNVILLQTFPMIVVLNIFKLNMYENVIFLYI